LARLGSAARTTTTSRRPPGRARRPAATSPTGSMDLRSTASLPSSSLTHRLGGQLLIGLLALFSSVAQARAQDLVPGAFTPAPVGFNIVTILANINTGEVVFDS